jgi:hypothetical protein
MTNTGFTWRSRSLPAPQAGTNLQQQNMQPLIERCTQTLSKSRVGSPANISRLQARNQAQRPAPEFIIAVADRRLHRLQRHIVEHGQPHLHLLARVPDDKQAPVRGLLKLDNADYGILIAHIGVQALLGGAEADGQVHCISAEDTRDHMRDVACHCAALPAATEVAGFLDAGGVLRGTAAAAAAAGHTPISR